MRKLASTLIGLSLLASPFLASADTTSTNTQVQAMLTQIQALQAQIQALKTAQTQVQTSAQNVSDTLMLIRSLKQGMSGEDIKTLQAILASDPTIYPEGTISGFYGRLTAEAVKKFQKKHGIEQAGNVGPKTLKKLNEVIKELGLSQESEDDDDDNDDNRRGNTTSSEARKNGEGKKNKLCIPPGHMIAPGWLKKNDKPTPTSSIPLCNNRGNGGNSSTTPQDKIAPVISAVGTSNLLGTTTSVVWTTNEASNSKVWFGTATPVVTTGAANITNASMVTSHSVPLSGLSTSTTYYFVVGSTDPANNTATSSQGSFVTTVGL